MIAEGADVPARDAYRLEQLTDLRADHFPGSARDDIELVHAADQRNPACDLPGEILRFLVAPDARRCKGLGNITALLVISAVIGVVNDTTLI